MKKLITMATAGIFLLSLQGASLAQEKPVKPTEKQAPATPKTEAPEPSKEPTVVKPSETKKSKAKAKAKEKAKAKAKDKDKAKAKSKAKETAPEE